MVLGSVLIDQITKIWAEEHLLAWSNKNNLKEYSGIQLPIKTLGQRNSIDTKSPDHFIYVGLNYVRNQGAAWGIFSNLKDQIRIPFFYIITIFATLVILLYWRQTPFSHRLVHFALALIFSGAIGNFIDRFRLGYVIDFIDVRWSLALPFTIDLGWNFFPESLDFFNISINTNVWRYDFPNFNWADSMITTGVCIILLDMIFFEPKRTQTNNA